MLEQADTHLRARGCKKMKKYLLIYRTLVVDIIYCDELPEHLNLNDEILYDTVTEDFLDVFNVGDKFDVSFLTPIKNTNDNSIMDKFGVYEKETENGLTLLVDHEINLNFRFQPQLYNYYMKPIYEMGFGIVTDRNKSHDYVLPVKCRDILENKLSLKNVLEKSNLPVIDYCLLQRENLTNFQNVPIIVKPIYGKFGVAHNDVHYKTFNSPQELIEKMDSDNLWDEEENKTMFVEKCIIEENGKTNRVVIRALINGNKKVRLLPTIEVTSELMQGKQNIQSSYASPHTFSDSQALNIVQSICDQFDIKNTILIIQCIVVDGIYYVHDMSESPPFIYAKFYQHLYKDHIKFIFDMADDIPELPNKHYSQQIITKLAVNNYAEVLPKLLHGARTYNSFFWIVKHSSLHENEEKREGRYWLISEGDTKEESEQNLQTYIEYLTTI
jgi:hypothetical protein